MRTDSLQKAESTGGDNVCGIIRDLEGNSNMRLGSEVVDLIRLNSIKPTAERRGVSKVGIVEFHAGLVDVVRIDVDVINALGVEIGGSTNQSMNFIVLVQQEFSQIRPVLAGYASDQSHFPAIAIGIRRRFRSAGCHFSFADTCEFRPVDWRLL